MFKGDAMSNTDASKKELPQKYQEYLQEMAVTRRRFLQGSAGMAGMLGLSQLLAACAPASSGVAEPAPTEMQGGATPAASTGTPKSGGTLVFAAEAIGESLDPGLWNGFGISNVIDNVGGCLTRPNSSGIW